MSFTTGHALVIGVGSYPNMPGRTVPITVGDARAMAELLQSPVAGYPASQVTLLHDAAATRAGIFAALAALARTTQPADTVLVFYAGHGDFGTDGHYYLTTHETAAQGGKVVAGSGLRDDTLLTALQAIPAERLVVIFNACHSGAAAPQSLGLEAPALPEPTVKAILGTGKGRVLLTACGATEKSNYLPGAPRTIFTDVLLGAISGAGVPSRAGGVSLYDLYPAVASGVTAEVQRRFQLVPQPEITIQHGQGAMILAVHPGGQGAGSMGLDDMPPAGARTVTAARAGRARAGAELRQSADHHDERRCGQCDHERWRPVRPHDWPDERGNGQYRVRRITVSHH